MTGLKEVFRLFLLRAFNIRAGEIDRVGLMQLNIFLIISTLLIVKPVANSLFISKLGVENLPKVFVLVAVVAAIVSTLYSRILARVSLGKLIGYTLSFSVISLLLFGTLLNLNLLEGAILYIFYVWVAVFALLATSQFWILANMVFNTREAKRLFGFIGAGAIAGGIFGGYLTSILVPYIGSERLLFVGAFLLVFTIPITRNIWKNVAGLKPLHLRQQKKNIGFGEHPMSLIRSSRHLTFLAAIVAVSGIVAKLVDYQFSAVAASLISDPDELTAFFGFWFSNLNVVSLLIQLFVTSRVVGTLGVGTSLFFLPGGIFIGAVALIFFPELWAAILIKVADGSLKQSINRASVELLALPIPLEIKNQTKTYIDVFIDSLATGIGGLILIFVVTGLDLPTYFISLIIIALLFVWGYFAMQVRGEYIKSFKLKVAVTREEKTNDMDFSRDSVLGGLNKVLENGAEQQIIYILRKVREVTNDKLFENTRKLLRHDSPNVRAEALRNLYFYSRHNLSQEVEPLTTDRDQDVKIQAFEYLMEHSPQRSLQLMNQYLNHADDKVSGAALVSLAMETRDNPTLKATFDLGNRIRQRMEVLASIPTSDTERLQYYTINLLKVIGLANIPYYYQAIERYLIDSDLEIVNQAIHAAGNTLSPQFIDTLIGHMETEEYKESAIEALAMYGQGLLPLFADKMEAGLLKIETIRDIPRICAKIPTQASVDFLFEWMDYDDHLVRLMALRALNRLKINHPNLKFHQKDVLSRILEEARLYLATLSVLYAQTTVVDKENKIYDARKSLIDLLERRLDGNLERIFRLLGLKYPPEDILNIYEGIQSKKPDMRINAVEFLDNLLDPGLNRILVPIVETAMLDMVSEEVIKNLDLKIPDEFECFEMLLKARDTRIKIAVLYLIAQLKDDKFLPLVEEYVASDNIKIRTFAGKARTAIREQI